MLRQRATYLAYAGGWQAVRRMPEPLAYGLFERLADHQWSTGSSSVRRLEANLRRVLGPVDSEQLRETSRAGMRSYLRYWCDTFRLPSWDDATIDSCQLDHMTRLSGPIERGRGVVVALPHMGNWDHAGAYACRHVARVTTVAEKLEPEQLYRAFLSYREALGMTIYGLGDPGVYDNLVRTLQGGGLVPLLADRDLSAKGIQVQFFGESARFPAGPAALAIDTGAALHPASLYWAGHNVADILPEIVPPTEGTRAERIEATTQLVANALEAAIREHPTDWHMLQRLFLADLDPARVAAAQAAGGSGESELGGR